ncbi:MAG: PHP domain-containing protein [Candidatus Delongbacteria bacterium]|nr:PHP domain-containing protein [Candidatus Delongbacteria bacterium]MBN2834974.1 PHP domain-containing protein [Candidatus Delongbacteria bacterium]
MNLIAYSSHSIPEGTLSVDELIRFFKSNNSRYCVITDHGTISSCFDFYKKALENNLKPIFGLEIFIKLVNDCNARLIIYLADIHGYRALLNIYRCLKLSPNGYSYIDDPKLLNSDHLFYLFSIFDYSYISKTANFTNSIRDLKEFIYHSPQDKTFIHIMPKIFKNESEDIVENSKSFGVSYLETYPLFNSKEKRWKLTYNLLKLRGLTPSESDIYRFKNISIENAETERIVNDCIFTPDDIILSTKHKYLVGGNEDLDFEVLIDIISSVENKILSDTYIDNELKIIKMHGYASYFNFLFKVKNGMYEKYGTKIYFTGTLEYFKLSSLLNLTISEIAKLEIPIYNFLLSNNPDFHIGVFCEIGRQEEIINYLKEILNIDRFALPSIKNYWNLPSIISSMGKLKNYPKAKTDSIIRAIPQNYRNLPVLEIIKSDIIQMLLREKLVDREFVFHAALLDKTLRYSSYSNSFVIYSNSDISDLIPVQIVDGMYKSDFSINDIKKLNLRIVEITALEDLGILNTDFQFKLKNDNLKASSENLIEKIKSNDLTYIPYFKYNRKLIEIFDLNYENTFMQLMLYLEEGLHGLGEIDEDYKKEDFLDLKKLLRSTGGKIAFREQFIIVFEKLFKGIKYKKMKYYAFLFKSKDRLLEYIEKNISSDDIEKLKLLKKMLLDNSINASLLTHLNRVFIALKLNSMLSDNRRFFIYRHTANSLRSRNFSISEVSSIINENKLVFHLKNISNLFFEYKSFPLTLPLRIINGISLKTQNEIESTVKNLKRIDLINFIDSFDPKHSKKHILILLAQSGFFTPLVNSKMQCCNMIEKIYKNPELDFDTKQDDLDFSFDYYKKNLMKITGVKVHRNQLSYKLINNLFHIPDNYELVEAYRDLENKILTSLGKSINVQNYYDLEYFKPDLYLYRIKDKMILPVMILNEEKLILTIALNENSEYVVDKLLKKFPGDNCRVKIVNFKNGIEYLTDLYFGVKLQYSYELNSILSGILCYIEFAN